MNKIPVDSTYLLKHFFNLGLQSLKPSTLINNIFDNNIKRNELNIQIPNIFENNVKGIELNTSVSENVYIAGFGKAALGFLNPLYLHFKKRYRHGIFSIPTPTEYEIRNYPDLFKISEELLELTSVYYGSRSNIPNEETIKASNELLKMIKSLTEKDTLIVVITGGGSALLCLPEDNITVEDIINLSTLLSKSGASIMELNTVRRQIDILKGGGIAILSNSKNVISLILSDVIGDDISLIASGPTVVKNNFSLSPLEILAKYNLINNTPERIINFLKKNNSNNHILPLDNIYNIVIGNNQTALCSMRIEATKHDIESFILTTKLDGDCELRSVELVKLLESLFLFMEAKSEERKRAFNLAAEQMSLEKSVTDQLALLIMENKTNRRICLLLGGETPVNVKQCNSGGKGGRCSHMGLSVFCLLQTSILKNKEIAILFGASDGMDGATDCAGVIIESNMVYDENEIKMNPKHYLNNFDSYNFFKNYNDGKYFLETGMTGTNVMDLIVILI